MKKALYVLKHISFGTQEMHHITLCVCKGKGLASYQLHFCYTYFLRKKNMAFGKPTELK